MASKRTWPNSSAVATTIGTVIGAGIFGIPYVFAQAGMAIGTVQLIALGAVTIATMVAYATVVVRTKKVHQLPGYAKHYSGRFLEVIAVISLIFGSYASLIAYTIEIGNFLHALLHTWIPLSAVQFGVLFWIFGSLTIVAGISAIVRLESLIVVALIIVLAIIALFAAPHIQPQQWLAVEWENAFVPYGVLLFAFGGASIIPELRRILTKQKAMHSMRSSVIAAMVIVGVLYLLFSAVVVGVSGGATSESAVAGLGPVMGQSIVTLGAILGIITMGSSFLITGLAVKQMYQHDFGIPRWGALLLTLVPPVLLHLLQFASFIQVIGIAGAITGGLQGIVIWRLYTHSMAGKSERKAEFTAHFPWLLILLLQAIFIGGIIYQLKELFF